MKIIIWSGRSLEQWGPSALETGIGGSETAVIHMAHHLAKLGNEVVCVGQHEGFEQTSNPTYVSIATFVAQHGDAHEADVFISSRDKGIVTNLEVLVRSKLKILWVHDLHVGDDPNNILNLFDKIFVLSEFALKTFRRYYPLLDSRKIYKTRNGIDTGLFSPGDTERTFLNKKQQAYADGPRFIYSSSPDRGLRELLDMWPQIAKAVPGSSLHVYYGFSNWKKMNLSPAVAEAVMFFEKRLLEMEKESVIYHGRQGQKALAEAMMASSLWLYPTAFKETSCITAMEAQAAGAFGISTKLGALPETLRHGLLIPPHNVEPRYCREFISSIKHVTADDDGLRLRRNMVLLGREHAMEDLSWKNVAQDWHARFIEWTV